MGLADRIKNNIFYLLAGGIYVFALAGATLSSTYIGLSDGRIMFIALLAMAFFCLWFYNRYTFWAGLCLLLASVAVVWLYLHGKDYDVAWFERLVELLQELFYHIQGLTPYRESYSVLGVVIIALFAMVTAGAIRSSASSFWFLGLLGFGVFGVLSFLQYSTSRLYLLAFLFIFVVLLARRLSRAAARTGGDLALNVNGLLLLPICLVLVLAASGLPQPAAAQGRSIRDNVQLNLGALDEFFYGTFSPKYFSFSTTGFSSASRRLGGNVTPNDRFVMEVYTKEGQRPYLAGAYKDVYTGDSWEWSLPQQAVPDFDAGSTYGGWADVGDSDLLLRHYQASDAEASREDVWDAMSGNRATVIIAPARATRSIFAPPSANAVQYLGLGHSLTPEAADSGAGLPDSPLAFSRSGHGALESLSAMEKGSAYRVSYIWTRMHEVGQKASAGLDQAFAQAADAADYAELASYLALPDSLPQRVRDLAQAVVDQAGATNPYAKMNALESYLQQFPYTLSPGGVPLDADFVDYFLFEGQQGYCTYYASALAVMGRCVGVPTRYAEGYVLPAEVSESGGYSITNAQAHAWCEAFFSMAGWTAFEATAPYNYPFYHNGQQMPAHDGYNAEEALFDIERFAEDEMLAEIRERNRQQNAMAATEAPEEAPADPAGRTGWFLLTLLLLLALAAGVCGLQYWRYQRGLRRLDALPNREAAIAYYGRILGLLGARGAPLLAGETAWAHGARLDGAQGDGPHCRLADIFCRASYSRQDISDTDRAEMAQGYARMLAQEDAELPARLKAFFQRFILGKY